MIQHCEVDTRNGLSGLCRYTFLRHSIAQDMFTDASPAVRTLSNHQTTDCLVQTEQAIRAVLANEQRHRREIELAENGAGVKTKVERLKDKPPGGKAKDHLGHVEMEEAVPEASQAPTTPISYNAPMSPPPAPRKPKRTMILNNTGATHEAEGIATHCIGRDEWTKAGR